MKKNSNNAAKNLGVPGSESQATSKLNAAPSFTPSPAQCSQNSIAKSVATYYANATAAEVWPGDNFYKTAPPFVGSWLVEGWLQKGSK